MRLASRKVPTHASAPSGVAKGDIGRRCEAICVRRIEAPRASGVDSARRRAHISPAGAAVHDRRRFYRRGTSERVQRFSNVCDLAVEGGDPVQHLVAGHDIGRNLSGVSCQLTEVNGTEVDIEWLTASVVESWT